MAAIANPAPRPSMTALDLVNQVQKELRPVVLKSRSLRQSVLKDGLIIVESQGGVEKV